MTFGSLPFLLAIPLGIVLTFALASRTRSDLSPRRRVLSLGVRSLLISLLLAAMAQPSYSRRAEGEAVTVFLLDVSASVSRPSLEEAASHIETLSRELSAAGRKSALIVFAGKAELVRPPSADPIVVPTEWKPTDSEERARREALIPARTDFGRALRTAESLALSSARYVFVTDGRDPSANAPRRSDVQFLSLPFRGRDVAAVGLRAPVAVRTGEPFDVRMDLHSTEATEIESFLLLDDREVRREKFRVPEGRSVQILRNFQPALSHGPHRIVVLVRAEGDAVPGNNLRGTSLFVVGRPRTLVVEETPGAGDAVAKMLQAHEFEVRRIPRSRWMEEQFADYDTVVAAEVRASELPVSLAQGLRQYVENGGGLWWIPSPDAALDLPRSPIASWLPVEFDPAPSGTGDGPRTEPRKTGGETGRTEKVLSATVALLLAVDKSGSMAGDKIELVKEACRATTDTLDDRDWLGVLAFDTRPNWVLEFTHPMQKETIRDRIYRLFADGGTDIYPALLEAHRALRDDPRAKSAGIRHVILFSDGDTRPADIQGQVSKMVAEGITVSTVCILQGEFDLFLMKEIADVGKGRFHYTSSFSNIPKIFTQEAKTLIDLKRPPKENGEKPVIPDREPSREERPKEGSTVLPKVLEEHEILWVDMPKSLPPLQGLLASRPRAGVRVPIGTEDRRPVLAIGRVGLGRVAVWTSDLSGRWSAEWLRWLSAPKLFAHLVRHLSTASEDLELAERVELAARHETGKIRVAAGSSAERLTLTRIQPRREEILLEPGSEGELRAEFPLEDEPTVALLTQERDGRVENLAMIFDRAYEDEFLPQDPIRGDTIEAVRNWLSTPGPEETKRMPMALWLILAAVLFLPLDVALKRIR